MFDFLRKLWSKPVAKVRILPRDPFRVTLREWRSNPELCKAAHTALANPIIRQMLDCLRTNHIGMWVIPDDTPLEVRAIRAAKCEGYGMTLNDLEAMASYAKPAEQIEATFDDDNTEFEMNRL